jgi:hypothetical protein
MLISIEALKWHPTMVAPNNGGTQQWRIRLFDDAFLPEKRDRPDSTTRAFSSPNFDLAV